MKPSYQASKKSHILYDGDRLGQIDGRFFEPDHWRGRGALTGAARGRGTAVFVRDGEAEYVLRHYRRGGLAARLSDDRYLWLGLEATRAWREWRLLALLAAKGLPVPAPVAARVVRRGLLYSADIATVRLPGRSLAQHAGEGTLERAVWVAVGTCIRRFHEAGVYHADLNAHNILIGAEGAVHLIDFDRGRLRGDGGRWRDANLARLRRSLDKLAAGTEGFAFTPDDWRALVAGYQAVEQAPCGTIRRY